MKKIAIQGIKGSFHQQVAAKFFEKETISYLECKTFIEVVKSVRGSDADYGVIAIENALVGTILPNYQLIYENDLKVIGEMHLPIQLDLLALPGQKIEDLKEVWSHPLAIAQSENFLEEHSHLTIVKKDDTATAAKNVHNHGLYKVGVLASPMAAKIYRLNTLATNVQNHKDSYTRFFVVSTAIEPKIDSNKVSLSFTLEHKSGSLVSILQKIADINLNLTKILSVPLTQTREEYSFYVDVVYNNREDFLTLYEHLKVISPKIKVFGEYVDDKSF